MAKKQKAVLLSVICAVFIILLISISAVWLSGRNSVKKSVTFEAGDAIEAGHFLSKKKDRAAFAGNSEAVDSSVPGEYQVSIKCGLFSYKCTAIIEDTIAPTAEAVTVYYNEGETVEAEQFVKNIQDKTKTTVAFVNEPDYSFKGKQDIEVNITDAGDNSTVVKSAMITRVAQTELIMEAGDDFPPLEAFLKNQNQEAAFVTDVSKIDTKHPAEYDIEIAANGVNYTTKLIIKDTIPPVIEFRNLSVYNVDTVGIKDFVVSENDFTEIKYSFDKEPDMTKTGDQNLLITASDEGNNIVTYAAVLTVLQDTEPPVISGVKDRVYFIGDSPDFKSGIKVTDNHDKDLEVTVDSSQVNMAAEGTYVVTYTVQDISGNVATNTANIGVMRDTEPPVISGAKDITAYVGESIKYKSGIKVTDNHDKNLTISVDDSNVNTNQPGSYTCVYSAADSAGNVATVTINVNIVAKPVSENNTPTGDFPYEIHVNRLANCVTVYTKDSNGNYTVPYTAFVCSCGNNTPTGTFKTSAKYTWRALINNEYGQYATRIVGSILFHSVPYTSPRKNALMTEEFNKLGQTASAGCVRLTVADVKWIYENCPSGTTVIIYNDENPGPLGKPSAPYISEDNGWDPTDPDSSNPWN